LYIYTYIYISLKNIYIYP